MHEKTHRRLHTHDIRPTTNDKKYQYEVRYTLHLCVTCLCTAYTNVLCFFTMSSAYGYKGFEGDNNDNWRVEIISDGSDAFAGDRLRARRSEFRLISTTQNCALFSRKYKLPDWGFGQQEVTCMKDALYARSLWRIETSRSDLCR